MSTAIDPSTPTAAELLRHVAEDPSRLRDPAVRDRHERLLANASVCSYCGVGCPYTVEDDHRGRPQVVPASALGLCVKGKTSLLTGSDRERPARLASRGLPDDRIRSPMLRGHDGIMKEVSWEEALDRAAWLMLHAREWVGPEALAIYGNGQQTLESIWVACLYKLVFRLPTIGANSEHCLASAGSAHELAFGNEASFTWKAFDELSRCDVAVLHGTNAFVTFPQAYEKLARNRDALKVVIDPVRTDTVSELEQLDPARTLHLRFRQGGDVLFNLAVARVILDEGWADHDFLARAVDPHSLDELRRLCAQERCRPEVAARSIALPGQDPRALAAELRRYAALLARPRPDGSRPRAAFVSSMGINQSTGSFGFATNLDLLLLTGNVGRRGAGSLRVAGQSNATSELMLGLNGRRLPFNLDPEDPAHRRRLAALLDLPEDNVPGAQGTPVCRMADDDRLYCFLFIGTQMTRNMPRLGHWQRRLGRAFNVVIDSFLGEGVLEHADVILPALTHTERQGVVQRGDRTLQLQQAISEPPPLAWSDEQILVHLALAIARRLRDPDTAAINELDPDVVHRSFARYLDDQGRVDSAAVFDHVVELSRQLDVYCRLEDDAGRPITHAMLRQHAGRGVQWGGDGRYRDASSEGAVFPGLQRGERVRARLVRPPDAFLDQLAAPLPPGTLSLVSGRGRPGRRARFGRGRYNSGIKTRPISGGPGQETFVEMHPQVAAAEGLRAHQLVRLLSAHGAAIARVALNDRVPPGVATVDFAPGEINRLTDYVDVDRFTNQSLIKRTPVRLRALCPGEATLWAGPDGPALERAVDVLFEDFRRVFPRDEDWRQTQRETASGGGPPPWLPPAVLQAPSDDAARAVAEAAGGLTAFLERIGDPAYREAAGPVLRGLARRPRDRLLRILMPFIRRMDYQSAMHLVLAELVGGVRLVDEHGQASTIDLLSAHRSAILEFKEEIVAIQLYVALRRAVEELFGPGAVVRRSELAFVSGIAIPCAGDVPAHFLGISPAELGAATLVHSRAIGSSALIVVDRRRDRAVRIDIVTGVLPKDRELTALRGAVINKKRAATGAQHRRFFDRLGELIVDYVRTGDDNFRITGPVPLPWDEYRDKLAFAPASRRRFVEHLIAQRVSATLVEGLVRLGAIDPVDADAVVAARSAGPAVSNDAALEPDQLYAGDLQQRVRRVVDTIIGPVLENDGGRLDVLAIHDDGDVEVRFVGSCANCPYSLLSMEQIVKPTMLRIPGVRRVVHRARLRDGELRAIGRPRTS